MIKVMAVVVLALALVAMPAYANPNKGEKASNAASQTCKAGDKLVCHTADAVADVLTGDDSSKSKPAGNTPPGLAKKGKTPPGWSKGKKEGWDKEPEKKDSPIQSFVKGLFGQK